MKYICAYCKTEVKWDDMFCPKCGRDIYRRKRLITKLDKYAPIMLAIGVTLFIIAFIMEIF